MSGVIKSADVVGNGAIRGLPLAAVGAGPVTQRESETERRLAEAAAQLAQLERRDEESRKLIDDLRKKVDQSFQDGLKEGRELGRKEADDGAAKALGRLGNGIERAIGLFERDLSKLETLAPAVAHAALARLIGRSDLHQDILTRSIAHHMTAIEAASIIRIEVSRRDFGDEEALARLGQAMGRPITDLSASNDLEAGGCRIKLSLGALEVGLEQQWAKLSTVLAGLATEGDAS